MVTNVDTLPFNKLNSNTDLFPSRKSAGSDIKYKITNHTFIEL